MRFGDGNGGRDGDNSSGQEHMRSGDGNGGMTKAKRLARQLQGATVMALQRQCEVRGLATLGGPHCFDTQINRGHDTF